MPQQVGKFDFTGIPPAGQRPLQAVKSEPLPDEAAFRQWYAQQAKRVGLSPDPDDPQQMYDYRAAFRAGAQPDSSGHWPSQFKKSGHPAEVVGGFNTRTGERVPGTPRADAAELVRLGWDPTTAERLAAMPERSSEALARRFGGQLVVTDTETLGDQGYDFSGIPRPAEHPHARALRVLQEFLTGATKGVTDTAVNMGALWHKVPGVSQTVDALYGTPGVSEAAFADPALRGVLSATTPAQRAGKFTERVAEYIVPAARAERVASGVASLLPKSARVVPHMAAQGAAGATVATVQGADPRSAALFGAISPPLVRGAVAAAQGIGRLAEPMVRAAIKPTVTAMRQVAGASGAGLDAKATKLVKFIIENRVTSPDKARAIFDDAEKELQRLLTSRNPPTDAPARAMRYLQALERSASRQGLAAHDVTTIRNAAAELIEGNMGETVVRMVQQPHPTLVDQFGKPLMVLVPQSSRQLRASVPAAETLDSARASSQWQTRKTWGEQKGAATESAKTVERAQRDAVKAAVPESRDLLQRESMAIQSRDVLDRMAFRQANREAVSLPAHVMAAGEVASGRVPILAFASNWLRNNGLKAGIYADALKRAVESGNAQNAAWALERLGVAVPAAAGGRR